LASHLEKVFEVASRKFRAVRRERGTIVVQRQCRYFSYTAESAQSMSWPDNRVAGLVIPSRIASHSPPRGSCPAACGIGVAIKNSPPGFRRRAVKALPTIRACQQLALPTGLRPVAVGAASRRECGDSSPWYWIRSPPCL